MARYECPRCHEACFTTDPPHLCSDLRKRHDRQAKAVALIVDVLDRYYIESGYDPETVALEIIGAISGRDLGTD